MKTKSNRSRDIEGNWFLFLLLLSIIIQSLYAIEVCPYIDGLNPIEVLIANSVIAFFLWVIRELVYANFEDIYKSNTRKVIILDTLYFLFCGLLWGGYNRIVHEFPIESAFKVLTGFLSVGILTGASLYSVRKVNLLGEKEVGSTKSNNTKFRSLSSDLLILLITVVGLLCLNGIFVIIKDLSWMFQLREEELSSATISIIIELLFIAIIYVFYIIVILMNYSKYIKLQLLQQKEALYAIARGELIKELPIQGNDEFGALSQYTNQMISRLGEHIDLIASIAYTQRLQQAFIPTQSAFKEELPNSFILNNPKEMVSGDFYWIKKVGTHIYFSVADCTGHGVPGAMVSAICVNALNMAMASLENPSPNEVLSYARESILEVFKCSQTGIIKDGMDISLCKLNTSTLELEWSGANNPLWMVSSDLSFYEIKPDKQSVGYCSEFNLFTNHKLQLRKNDMLYLFSDGYADQFGGSRNKKIKRKAFKQLLIENSQTSVSSQELMLSKYFDTWKGNYDQIDDVCVVGVRL